MSISTKVGNWFYKSYCALCLRNTANFSSWLTGKSTAANIFIQLLKLLVSPIAKPLFQRCQTLANDAITRVKTNGLALRGLDQAGLKMNPEVVLAAANQNVDSLEYADTELREDVSFMLRACQINPRACRYASNKVLTNSKFLDPFFEQERSAAALQGISKEQVVKNPEELRFRYKDDVFNW